MEGWTGHIKYMQSEGVVGTRDRQPVDNPQTTPVDNGGQLVCKRFEGFSSRADTRSRKEAVGWGEEDKEGRTTKALKHLGTPN